MNTIISAEDLHTKLGENELVIFDCRFDLLRPEWGRQVYSEGHIPGATYLSLDADLSGPVNDTTGRHPLPDESVVSETLRRHGVTQRSQIVVYDQSTGAFAARAWWILRWLGHQRVAVLDGGFARWTAQEFDVSRAVPDPDGGDFHGKGIESMLVEANELLDQVNAGVPLFDARDADRFSGRVEPLDSVAGHIPGARNAPFTSFLDETGAFLDEQEIRHLWTTSHGIQPGQDWMVMCGSGVTACHLALSAQLAGLSMPQLYSGSWSEWIRDPDRPVSDDT